MNLLSVLSSLLFNSTYIYIEKYSLLSLGIMAHTKQTPRNLKIDRPTAAVGSDVQPERRVPLKLTSKKIATKGGKQPQKHLLHKLIRQNKTSTGGIKKPL